MRSNADPGTGKQPDVSLWDELVEIVRALPPLPLRNMMTLSLLTLAVIAATDNPTLHPAPLFFGLLAITILAIKVPEWVQFAVPGLGFIAVLSASDGSTPSVHLVPVLVVFAAGVVALSGEGRNWLRPSTIIAAPAAFFLSVLFSSIILRPNPSGNDLSGSGFTDHDYAERAEIGEPGLLGRFVSWLAEQFGGQAGGSAPGVGPGSTGADDPTDWLRLLIIFAAFLAILIAGYLIWRFLKRRSAPIPGGGRSDLVARFEKVGADVGMARAEADGLLAYGQALTATGDGRPAMVGKLVSGAIYDPAELLDDEAAQSVRDLELNPLPAYIEPVNPSDGSRLGSWFPRRRDSSAAEPKDS